MCERPVRAGVRCVVFVFAFALLLLLLLVLVLAGGATGRPLEFAFEFEFGVALALVAPALELLLPLFGGSVFAERLRLKYCVNPLVAFVVVAMPCDTLACRPPAAGRLLCPFAFVPGVTGDDGF